MKDRAVPPRGPFDPSTLSAKRPAFSILFVVYFSPMDARSPTVSRPRGRITLNVAVLVNRARLASGLVMFSYISGHLVTHALGVVSLDSMLWAQVVFNAVWHFPPMAVLLLGAAVTHIGLALWSIYRRRQLRMPPWEAAQLLFGLAIPPVLVDHVIGMQIAQANYGINADYVYMLYTFGTVPVRGTLQGMLVVVAWVHGCIGINYWLRLKPWYRDNQPIALAIGVLVPVLALAGYYGGIREVMALARDMDWVKDAFVDMNLPGAAGFQTLAAWRGGLWTLLAVLLGMALMARVVRDLAERRRGRVKLSYPGGRQVSIAPGMTLLEISRAAGIPHASVCGGRGRCSTCRVRCGAGVEHLAAPSAEETRVLKRFGASPNIRLACQIRPTADLELTPLVAPAAGLAHALKGDDFHIGREVEIAVLFADLRGFTSLAEHRLPFDTVFLLNRYFAEMGGAIESAGGHLDKFIGDGVMALFGLRDGAKWGAIGALTAAKRMHERLAQLNADMASELPQPLRLGIGIHTGPVIVGDMGYGEATALTAIGDVVNTASRLESLTKEHDCQLVVSADTARLAGLSFDDLPRATLVIRGRDQSIEVGIIKAVETLAFTEDRRLAARARLERRGETPTPTPTSVVIRS
jgi:adenylate cyclase